MCGGPEHTSHAERQSPFKGKMGTAQNVKKFDLNSSSYLLELAANDDLKMFVSCVEEQNAKLDEVGVWYVRHSGTSQMLLEQRTPAMVAALHGSMNVLTYIVNYYAMYGGDIDQVCGSDGCTAMHCAAAGGSACTVQVVQLLLDAGARIDVCDSKGRRPWDVLAVSLSKSDAKFFLEGPLNRGEPRSTEHGGSVPVCFKPIGLAADLKSCSSSSALSTASGVSSLSMSLSASSSPKSPHTAIARGPVEDSEYAREFSLDTSLPDIKNTFYSNDEFRMYSFKIRPCSRAYSHDWTECPFAHPGENARRRDPRKYHYSCVPCPDFRKGACGHGDACEYAHGVFECWLHPAQYRTRLCKDGVECNRKVCFFAHRQEELRPVYASTGSGLPSPMSAAFTDMSCMSPPPLAPCSPSVVPPYSPLHSFQSTLQGSMRTPPMSPVSSAWPQATIPTLNLPGTSLQSSRLRSAFTARDVAPNSALDEQLINEFQSLSAHHVSSQARLKAALAASGNVSPSSRSGRYKSLGLTVARANLEELFASESLPSPGLCVREANMLAQFEHIASSQKQSNAAQGSVMQSPRELPHVKLGSSVLGASNSKGPRVTEEQGISKGAVLPALVAARAALSQGSRSSPELGASKDWWADWGSPTGKLEWGMKEDDLSNLRKSASFRVRGSVERELEPEPDLAWVQKLVKEGSAENDESTRVVVKTYLKNGRDKIQREGGVDTTVLVSSWGDTPCVDQVAA